MRGMPTPIDFADIAFSKTAVLFQGGEQAGISIFVVTTPPGGGVGLHVHPYAETFVLLEGQGRWTVGEQAVELQPRQIVVVPPETPHGFENTGDRPLLLVSVHDSGTMRQRFLDED
jgi:mannose-6-phosphate isomerase-like protein (cupin superfamily)